jgi:hypothetical protein
MQVASGKMTAAVVAGKVAWLRYDRRVWIGAAVALVAIYLAATTASGSARSQGTAPGVGTTPLIAANPTSSTPGTAVPAVGTSASPIASSVDGRPTPSGPSASFVPSATPIGLPSSGGSSADRLPGEPDPSLTPGALNPMVIQTTIQITICLSGWTSTIRPSDDYTGPLKIKQIAQYGYADTNPADYEEDHLIPLELGGHPTDPLNLWPEPRTIFDGGAATGSDIKDGFETTLKEEVCAGKITLAQAQAEIGDNWVHYYLGISLKPSPAASATVAVTPAAALSVEFVSLPNPAPRGGVAHLSASTSPGATCSIIVVWPSGNKSGAGGLKALPTAGDDGVVSWSWNAASTTKPGTAKATVTCSLSGKTAQGVAHFPVG